MDDSRNRINFRIQIIIFCLWSLPALTVSCDFGAPGCTFPCHCADAKPCDPVTGACAEGCDDGNPRRYTWPGAWSGPGCQIGNVAFQKPTNFTDYVLSNLNSSLAVDGVSDPTTQNGHCAVLFGNPGVPTLTVNLEVVHVVLNVSLQNYILAYATLVEVGRDGVWFPCNDTISHIDNTTYVCHPALAVTQVRVKRQVGGRNEHVMPVCEVMIWGYLYHNCSNGRFGPGCLTECHCFEQCDAISGACPVACEPGWRGKDCQQECLDGNWGSDCAEVCHCRDPVEVCRKDNGNCSSGCAEGAFSRACAANCTNGAFGLGCATDCHCLEQCDVISGVCPVSCEPGWRGEDCQQACAAGWWGSDCVTECRCKDPGETCRRDTGSCTSGCDEGRVGVACDGAIPNLSGWAEIAHITSYSMDLRCQLWTRRSTDEIPPNVYRIQIRRGGDSNWFRAQEIKSRDAETVGEISVVIGGLYPSTTYHVRVFPVVSVHGTDFSGDGVAVSATTLGSDPHGLTSIIIGLVVSLVILAIGIGIAFKCRLHQLVKKRLRFEQSDDQIQFYAQQHDAESARPSIVSTELGACKRETIYEVADKDSESPPDSPPRSEKGNLYENQVILQNPILVADLASYVQKRNDIQDGYWAEFEKIPSGQSAKWDVGDLPVNRVKHRFLNINAYDHSRVVLDNDEADSDYINANYVPSYTDDHGYIAAQGPKINTLEDTWRMIWQTKANRVVMVTNIMEAFKAKCEPYWPIYDNDKFVEFGPFVVRLLETIVYAEYIIRTLSVEFQGASRHIRHYHFIGWPDHGAPQIATSVLDFRSRVRAHDKEATGPMVVHCSAGIGRSGTFMAIDYLLDQATTAGVVDVLHYVCLMRTCRINMVQNVEQYGFVYNALAEGFATGTTSIPCRQMAQVMSNFTADGDSKDDTIEKQFQVLNSLPHTWLNEEHAGHLPENITKNRDANIVPPDWARPELQTDVVNGATDYINAVFVNSYRCRREYIVTQCPLSETLYDFWRLVHDHHCTAIVLLEDTHDDEDCPVYWPQDPESDPIDFDPLTVDCTMVENEGDVTIREFQLETKEQDSETRLVRQFHLRGWSCDSESLPDVDKLLSLLVRVENWKQTTQGGPIVVHCKTGVGASGLFCAASVVLEKLRVDREVDVRLAVALTRQTRPQFIRNLDEYVYLHQLALVYIQKYEDYVNVNVNESTEEMLIKPPRRKQQHHDTEKGQHTESKSECAS